MGFKAEKNFDEIIKVYQEDEMADEIFAAQDLSGTGRRRAGGFGQRPARSAWRQ